MLGGTRHVAVNPTQHVKTVQEACAAAAAPASCLPLPPTHSHRLGLQKLKQCVTRQVHQPVALSTAPRVNAPAALKGGGLAGACRGKAGAVSVGLLVRCCRAAGAW